MWARWCSLTPRSKFYLTADVTCRAQRRVDELRSRGVDADLDATLREIEERDGRDKGRAVAPLRAT